MSGIDAKLMDGQNELRTHHRSTLFDWLCEINELYHYSARTLDLAFIFHDVYLTKMGQQNIQVPKARYQLLGAGCFIVACKCEEVRPPTFRDLIYLMDNQWQLDSILDMEREIIATLDYQLFSNGSAYEWLGYFVSQMTTVCLEEAIAKGSTTQVTAKDAVYREVDV